MFISDSVDYPWTLCCQGHFTILLWEVLESISASQLLRITDYIKYHAHIWPGGVGGFDCLRFICQAGNVFMPWVIYIQLWYITLQFIPEKTFIGTCWIQNSLLTFDQLQTDFKTVQPKYIEVDEFSQNKKKISCIRNVDNCLCLVGSLLHCQDHIADFIQTIGYLLLILDLTLRNFLRNRGVKFFLVFGKQPKDDKTSKSYVFSNNFYQILEREDAAVRPIPLFLRNKTHLDWRSSSIVS